MAAQQLCGASGDAFIVDSITRRLPQIIRGVKTYLDQNAYDDQLAVVSVPSPLPPTLDGLVATASNPVPTLPSRNTKGFISKSLGELADAAEEGTSVLPVVTSSWGYLHCSSHPFDHTWLSTPWFHVEHCVYAHLRALLWDSMGIDFFAPHKQESLTAGLPWLTHALSALDLPSWLDPATGPQAAKAALPAVLDMALWGNRADLSLSAGVVDSSSSSSSGTLLVDGRSSWLEAVESGAAESPGSPYVVIVLDNCGHELLADLVLSFTLLRSGVVSRVVLVAKDGPVFVSDAMPSDVSAHLEQMAEIAPPEMMSTLEAGLEVVSDPFFTSDADYASLPVYAPHMAALFADSVGVIIKGDANYRRLLDDRDYPPTTPVADVFGAFAWAPLLSLRTCKSPVAIGLEESVVDAAAAADANWCVNGTCGMAQFAPAAPGKVGQEEDGESGFFKIPVEVWCLVMKSLDWRSRFVAGMVGSSALRAA